MQQMHYTNWCFNMQDLLTPNKIIRSKRKTLSLIINDKNELIVRAPITCKDGYIFDFINKKASWIIKKRTSNLNNSFEPIKVVDNENIILLGNNYTIKLTNLKTVKIKDNIIFVPTENSKNKLIMFCKRYLKSVINTKIKQINAIYHFNVLSVSISSAKTNWGSCSAVNRLHFTYKLILCPEQVLDYIIVHELVHTQIKNHSKKYWDRVKQIYPNYKQCEKWLKENRTIVNVI